MAHYIIRRIIGFIPMLFLVSIISFIIIELPPGSFVENKIMELEQLGGDASSILRTEELQKRYGLDQPLWQRYCIWIRGIVLHGDFGEAFAFNQPVNQVIWSYLGYTLLISGCSFLLVYLLAIPLGIYAAVHKYEWSDHVISACSFIGMSLPGFLLALVLLVAGVFLFDHALIGIVSPQYQFRPWNLDKVWDMMKHLPIPALIVAVNGTAGLMRIMRGNMLEVLGREYIRTARAKGLSQSKIIGRHAFRMAVNPIISIIGMSLPGIFSGSAIISIVLNLPTAGYLLFASLKTQDMYLSGALILMLSLVLLVGNLLADIVLAWVDPRIRYE